MRNIHLVEFGLCLGLALGVSGAANAQKAAKPDATYNKCWGNQASQMGNLGIMGQHSRSGKAPGDSFADGFVNPETGEPIMTEPRQGVGNVSQGAPHNTHPSQGGNGIHANNNAFLSGIIDPATGLRSDGQTNVLTPCEGVPNTLGIP